MIKVIMDLIMVLTAIILIFKGLAGESLDGFFLIIVGAVMVLELVTDFLFHSH